MSPLTATVSNDNHGVCCRPGDITITPVPSGFLIGRALPEIGPGPWWEYIKVLSDYDQAMEFALKLAAKDGSRAWYHVKEGTYEAID